VTAKHGPGPFKLPQVIAGRYIAQRAHPALPPESEENIELLLYPCPWASRLGALI